MEILRKGEVRERKRVTCSRESMAFSKAVSVNIPAYIKFERMKVLISRGEMHTCIWVLSAGNTHVSPFFQVIFVNLPHVGMCYLGKFWGHTRPVGKLDIVRGFLWHSFLGLVPVAAFLRKRSSLLWFCSGSMERSYQDFLYCVHKRGPGS